MKIKNIIKSLAAFSALVGTCGLAYAQSDVSYVYATVLEADPMVRIVSHSTPREECWREQVVRHEQRAQSPTGAIMGGIIGAAIGHELGHHKRNKQVGAVAGALLGSAVGNDVSRAHAGTGQPHVVTQQRCRTVFDAYEEEQITGYRVIYRYNGKNYTTQTRQHPGDTLKLRVSVTPIQ